MTYIWLHPLGIPRGEGLCEFAADVVLFVDDIRKGSTKAVYCILPDGILNMKVVGCHIHLCVSHNALDGLKIHSEALELADISVATAVRREDTHALYRGEGGLELISKIRRVTGSVDFTDFPDVFSIGIA